MQEIKRHMSAENCFGKSFSMFERPFLVGVPPVWAGLGKVTVAGTERPVFQVQKFCSWEGEFVPSP